MIAGPLSDILDRAEPSDGSTLDQPVRKAFQSGTHRLIDPNETVARAQRLFGPLGITRVANVTGLDKLGIPVVMVCRPNARSLAVSQGKGTDYPSACASGIMESIELYHAERIIQPLLLASANELRFRYRLVPIESLPRVSVSVFHSNLPILWIEGTDLNSSEACWVPYELVHMNYTIPLPTGSGCFVMSSNGLASGNHLLEAINHGLCELIERDAMSVFRAQDAATRQQFRIDLNTVTNSAFIALRQRCEAADVQLMVWDITSDIGIPAFRCVLVDNDEQSFPRLAPIEGMGCHPARDIALLRAVTEAAQGRLTLIAGSRDDNGKKRYFDIQDHELYTRARQEVTKTAHRRYEDVPDYLHQTFDEDNALILARLRDAGLANAIVVNLTRPEFEVPVVRVVVPGLETFHDVQGYVPGKRALRVLKARAGEELP